jgi:hypothetical protein
VGGLELPEVLPHPSGLDPVPSGQPLDGALGESALVVGLVGERDPAPGEVGDAGGMGLNPRSMSSAGSVVIA